MDPGPRTPTELDSLFGSLRSTPKCRLYTLQIRSSVCTYSSSTTVLSVLSTIMTIITQPETKTISKRHLATSPNRRMSDVQHARAQHGIMRYATAPGSSAVPILLLLHWKISKYDILKITLHWVWPTILQSSCFRFIWSPQKHAVKRTSTAVVSLWRLYYSTTGCTYHSRPHSHT